VAAVASDAVVVRGVLERGVALGEAAADRRRALVLAEALEVPGVTVREEGDAVVIEGRALVARWVEDVGLRYRVMG
jgi:hypothetical protein